jgi:hypothetical protein
MISLINVFTVDPANQHRLLDLLARATDEFVIRAPGFVSSTLHRSREKRAQPRIGVNGALPRLPLTGPQQSARLLLVPPAGLVWSFGGRRDRAAGSKATSGNLGR